MSVGDEHDQSVADHDGPKARPLPDSEFLAFGEAGVADATQQRVAARMRSWVGAGRPVDALVEASDEVYLPWQPWFVRGRARHAYTGLGGPTRPLWVALGNLDVASGNAGADQLAYLGLPSLPYAKTLPGVQLLVLDAKDPDVAQKHQLATQLSAPGPAVRVVVFHQPAYSCGTTHGSTPAVDTICADAGSSLRRS